MHYPECMFNIRHLVMMGDSAGRGNFTPNAELNITVDPEAAARIFRGGIDIVICGPDATNHAMLSPEFLNKMPTLNCTGKMLLPCSIIIAAVAYRRPDARSLRDSLAGALGIIYP